MRRKHLFPGIFFPDFLDLKQDEVAPITVDKPLLSTPKDPSPALIVVGMLGTMELDKEERETEPGEGSNHTSTMSRRTATKKRIEEMIKTKELLQWTK